MRIGVFDSGLGGLIITKSLMERLPQYDYIYLGDTARVPYGNRSQATIYEFTQQAVEYLFRQDCQLVIIACNTASAEALRKIQQEYLPQHYSERRVLGVLIPAAEEVAQTTRNNRVGIIATRSTVDSQAYVAEIHKLNADIAVFQQATPLLVPLVENNALQYAEPILKDYLTPLLDENIDTLVLGCTHYPLLKPRIQAIVGDSIKIIAQDDIIPGKLAEYLSRHSEIAQKLSQNVSRQFLLTDITTSSQEVADTLFQQSVELRLLQSYNSLYTER